MASDTKQDSTQDTDDRQDEAQQEQDSSEEARTDEDTRSETDQDEQAQDSSDEQADADQDEQAQDSEDEQGDEDEQAEADQDEEAQDSEDEEDEDETTETMLLELDVQPIDLDLLGLHVQTERIHVELGAIPEDGKLLGKLLDKVAKLLSGLGGIDVGEQLAKLRDMLVEKLQQLFRFIVGKLAQITADRLAPDSGGGGDNSDTSESGDEAA